MPYKDTGEEIEFVNALGDEPTVFAAGSAEDFADALDAGRRINDLAPPHSSGETVSPGAFYALGRLSDSTPESLEALLAYATTMQAAIEDRRRAMAGDSDQPVDQSDNC